RATRASAGSRRSSSAALGPSSRATATLSSRDGRLTPGRPNPGPNLDGTHAGPISSDRPLRLTREERLHFSDTRLPAVWAKDQTRRRLTRDDGLLLFETDDLLLVARLASPAKSA